MTSFSFWKRLPALLGSVGVVAALAQAPAAGVLSVVEPQKLTAKRTGVMEQQLKLQLKAGYHVNSNKPADEYLIPLRLTWVDGPLEAAEVQYPKPKFEKYEFSEKPLSVYDGEFDLVTKFKVKAGTAPGPAQQAGKLRYQACNDKMCLPPKTIEVKLPVLVE
jgi:hypothetical protein